MVYLDEDALICDLAETYHIYNYREMPSMTVASLACGLRANSRILQKLGGFKHPIEQMIEFAIIDRLSILVWQNSADGAKGTNKPTLILSKEEEKEAITFDSGEAFDEAWKRITKKGV